MVELQTEIEPWKLMYWPSILLLVGGISNCILWNMFHMLVKHFHETVNTFILKIVQQIIAFLIVNYISRLNER